MGSSYQSNSMRRACDVAKKFVIERCYICHIIANMGFRFLVMAGQALMMNLKGGSASRDDLIKLWEGALIICNAITM